MAGLRTVLEQALGAEGLVALDRDSSLVGPLARECLGADDARWDLWGRDLADVFAVLAGRGATPTAQSRPGGVGAGVDLGKAAPSPTPPVTAETAAGTATPRTRRRRSPLILVVGLLLLAVLGGTLAFSATRPDVESSGAGPSDASAEAVYTEFSDAGDRFTLTYPQDWEPAPIPDPGVAFNVIVPAGTGGMRVRPYTLPAPIDPANLADVKAVTDLVVSDDLTQILDQKQIDIDGLKGYYYLYTQVDPATQTQGVFSHFFLFQGPVMHIILFFAESPEEFTRLAPEFDRVVQSYQATT